MPEANPKQTGNSVGGISTNLGAKEDINAAHLLRDLHTKIAHWANVVLTPFPQASLTGLILFIILKVCQCKTTDGVEQRHFYSVH